eukprot:354068-Chlamydomonas_euryale.AAC.4
MVPIRDLSGSDRRPAAKRHSVGKGYARKHTATPNRGTLGMWREQCHRHPPLVALEGKLAMAHAPDRNAHPAPLQRGYRFIPAAESLLRITGSLRDIQGPFSGWGSYCIRNCNTNARSVAEDGRVERLKLRQGHRNIEDFLGCTALQFGHAMRKVPAVTLPFGTSSSWLVTLNPLARDLSSVGGTCLGQASLAGRY